MMYVIEEEEAIRQSQKVKLVQVRLYHPNGDCHGTNGNYYCENNQVVYADSGGVFDTSDAWRRARNLLSHLNAGRASALAARFDKLLTKLLLETSAKGIEYIYSLLKEAIDYGPDEFKKAALHERVDAARTTALAAITK